MKVTAREEFGLRLLTRMARGYAQGLPVSTQELADEENLSIQFVSKLMQLLKDGGLVTAVRGRNGGYTLSRDPRAIMLDEAMTVLGGRLFDSEYCSTWAAEGETCAHQGTCALRPVWGTVELLLSAALRRISLADLLESERELLARLAGAREETASGEAPTPGAAAHFSPR